MKKIVYLITILSCLMLTNCALIEPHMRPYNPEPFTELNGKAFATLIPWKEHPDKGSYMVIYDLENLKTVKQIPLEGVSSFWDTCYYWNGKYYFQNIRLNFQTSTIEELSIGVVDARDGKVRYLKLWSMGHCTGITRDGKMYILGGYSLEKKAIKVTAVDAKNDRTYLRYYKPSYPMGTFSELGTNYINPANGYAYFWEQYVPETRILRFRTSDDSLEEVYNFGAEIQALQGALSEDGKQLFVTINRKDVLSDQASPELLKEQNTLVVIDTENRKLKEVIDLPSPEWLFGEDMTEDEWATAWVAVYKDWVYITAYKESDLSKDVLFKYNVKTGEFVRIGEMPPMYTFDIVGDKLVAVTSYDVNERITVIDLKTDEIIVNDESIRLYE